MFTTEACELSSNHFIYLKTSFPTSTTAMYHPQIYWQITAYHMHFKKENKRN